MRNLLLCAVGLLIAFASMAQEKGAAYWRQRYETQTRNLGPAGIGVETIIDRWEAELPEDPEAKLARFVYCFYKAQSVNIVEKDAQRFMGRKPALSLKDSLGKEVNYFEEEFYDEEYFAAALKAIDAAIALAPLDLRYAVEKISALFAYEKESPDLAYAEILAILDRDQNTHPNWKLDSKKLEEDSIEQLMQEYCLKLYNIGSPTAYDMFYELSVRLSKIYRKSSVFISNQASYWLVAKDNPRKAKSLYKKALKLDPEDYAAQSNLKVIQSLQSRKGQSSK